MSQHDVIIVGGGISGMSLAHYCAKKGLKPFVMEKSGRMGGTFNSCRTDNFWFELGAHSCYNSYGNLVDLLREIGSLDKIIKPVSAGYKLFTKDGIKSILSQMSFPELLFSLPRMFGAKMDGETVESYYSKIVGKRNFEQAIGPMFNAVICQKANEFPADMLFKKRARRKEVLKKFGLPGGLQSIIDAVVADPAVETAADKHVTEIAFADNFFTMGAAAEAVATTPIRATNFIAICTKACEGASTNPDTPNVLSPPRQYDRDPTQVPDEASFAWTSLLQPVSSVPQISPLICTETPNVDVCGRQIWTTQGEVTDLFRDMEGAFNDPNFDRANKEFTNGQVSAWWIIAPVTYVCKPGNQPAPFDVWGYALLRVTSVCDIGGGQPCRPFKSTPCNYPKKVVIDRIACVTCANAANALGFKPILVQ
jgi:hypothetical protein